MQYKMQLRLVDGLKFRPKGAVMGKFDEVFQRSVDNPEKFWAEAAKDITWYKEPEKVLDEL